MTQRQARNAVTMFINNTPISAIAAKYSVSENAIRYHIKRSVRGRELLQMTDKEILIEEHAKTIPAREIAKITNLQETTTRNYACSRHISLEYDRISYTPLEIREIKKFIGDKSHYTSIAELATAFNRSYSSVYQKVAELKTP